MIHDSKMNDVMSCCNHLHSCIYNEVQFSIMICDSIFLLVEVVCLFLGIQKELGVTTFFMEESTHRTMWCSMYV